MPKKPTMTTEDKILKFVGENPNCSRANIADGTKIDATKLSPLLRRLVQAKSLTMVGQTRGSRYSKPSPKPAS